MRRLGFASAGSIILAVTLAGCSGLYFDWDSAGFRPSPEQAATTALPTSAHSTRRQSASVRPRSNKVPTPTETEENQREEEASPKTAPATVPAPAPSNLSMASSGDSSVSAQKAIDATSARLARYDRSRLSGVTLATYDEANGFLNQSRQALTEKDYVAASGFAQKAALLADKLQATVTAR